MIEPLPPRSAIVDACELIGYSDIEDMVECVLKNPCNHSIVINIARRLTELRPDLYPADPDPITLAVREIVARCAEEWIGTSLAEQVIAGDRDDRPYCTQGRAVIEKLIEETKP